MKWLALRSLDAPRATLLIGTLLTLVLGAGALRLELRTDGDALTPEGNPVVEQARRDRLRFRDPRTLLLLVNARSEQRLLASPAGFRFLRELQARLRRSEALRPTGILSLATLPRLERGGGMVKVGSWLDTIPDDEAGFAALLAELRAHPLSDGLLLSADGRHALFALPLSELVSVSEGVRQLEHFCDEAANSDYELLLGGPLVAETTLGEKVLLDLAVLVPLMLVVMVALLYAMLRCPGGVLVPMLETGIVLVWTFGAMGWAGAPIALVTTILPVVLMAMCITDEIHLLERVLAGGDAGSMRTRVETALGEVGRPIVLTSLTTALGFLSFTSASIGPLREFGIFAAFGILSAMLLTFSVIPAMMVLLPEGAFAPAGPGPGERGLGAFGRLVARRPGVCFGLGIGAVLLLLPGVGSLRVSDSWVQNFAPGSQLVRSEGIINGAFWGSYRFDVVLTAPRGTFRDPPGMALLEALRDETAAAPYVGGVETALTPLEEIAAALGEPGRLSELAPEKVWDVFTLAEMSESRAGLDRMLTAAGDVARVRLYVRSPDYSRALELTRHLDSALPPRIEALGLAPPVSFHYSGDLPLASALVESIVENQLRSVGWALVTIALLLLLFSRRLSALLAMAPVVAATSGLFGLMGLLGIELGIATSMFASLAVGVGVDFGIHFLHRFEQEQLAGHGYGEAIRATVAKAGRALFWNAVVLAAGFAVLMASSLKPNHTLGLLLAAATLACYAGSLLLLPFLLRRGQHRGESLPASSLLLLPLLLLACFLAPSPVRAGEIQCGKPPDAEATRIMSGIEAQHRSLPRILRMHITTRYRKGERLATVFADKEIAAKTLWGAVDGNPKVTQLLYVFSGPGRMAGTGLLLRDFSDPRRQDATWFYLRAFDHFERLRGAVESTVIPSSALTYEDARGFIAVARYGFRFLDTEPAAVRRILGCPRTPEIADRLGYGAIVVEVDVQRQLVLSVDYRGLGGAELKGYRLTKAVEFAGQTFPASVLLEHRVDGFDNEITYEYWSPGDSLTPEFFRPRIADGSYLSRMRRLLAQVGLGERIEAEIAEADARVRAYEKRWPSSKRAAGDSASSEDDPSE
ncbi:MAG: MMPL family transporter [Deltaproteobacteria bacterium]|nr:MMPL family transporter [Deltaproteobacteria bacterium]